MRFSIIPRKIIALCFRFFPGHREFATTPGPNFQTGTTKAVVLSPGPIPTTDIYLTGLLEETYKGGVRYLDTLSDSPASGSPDSESVFIIVRYAPVRWLRWLVDNREKFSGMVFMVDDDLEAALQDTQLPLTYAMKTAWRYALTKRFLGDQCNEIWVSTQALARCYAACATQVRASAYVVPFEADRPSPVYFYHGTWAHRREIQWLVPIVKEIQRIEKNAWFEIMGNNRVKKMFAGIPRVRTVFPMSWPNYLAYAAIGRYQVGLAPCLQSDFNAGRSHSKIFDITRLGAAGIYANTAPYAGKILHGKTGLLCRNDRESWIAAILLLLRHSPLRSEIADNALAWCEERAVGTYRTGDGL
jgi:hypothetical protein